jgi:hypothetical protein
MPDMTPQEKIDDANELARHFYRSLGYVVEEGYRFDKATHPQERGMWNMAAIAYDHIEGTELDAILDEMEPDGV